MRLLKLSKKLILAFCLLANAAILSGQVFAFVQNTTGSQNSEPVSGYKFKVAAGVFEKLLQAHGDLRLQVPELVMNRRERYVAWMNAEQVQIGLEEKAYDICVGFGKDSLNALATLLGHELTHYYEKHDWTRHFAMENENLETARQLERIEEGLKQETQADYLGGFLALSAGFYPFGIMPELLKKIYQGYGLPEQLPGYPPLKDRIKMVDSAQKRLEELGLAFEIGQRLTLIGQYESALSYQKYILMDFQSRELHSNAAANSLLAAISLTSASEMPYALPVELDPDSRLFGTRNNDAERLERRDALLKTAGQQLEMALALDAQYAPAMLNKSCLFLLKGEVEDAQYWAKKGQAACKNATAKRPFQVLLAICSAMQEETDKATQILTPLAQSGYGLAKTNLDILQKKSPVAAVAANNGLAEQIEQFRLQGFLASPSVDKEVKISEAIFCGAAQKKYSRIFIHYADNGAHYAVWQETDATYTGSTQKGITLKSSAADVEKAYGPPAKQIAMPNGESWVYPALSMYFNFNADGMVRNWGVFLSEQ